MSISKQPISQKNFEAQSHVIDSCGKLLKLNAKLPHPLHLEPRVSFFMHYEVYSTL